MAFHNVLSSVVFKKNVCLIDIAAILVLPTYFIITLYLVFKIKAEKNEAIDGVFVRRKFL